jgi:hypothetical protein
LRACGEGTPGVKAAASRTMWPGLAAVTPRQIVFAELFLLGIVLATFAWFVARIYGGPYLPSSAINDGFGYFLGAKSFYLNHTLGGPSLHLDNVSLIGEFYAHGFAYSLINGGAAFIVGWHDRLIIALNLVLLAMAALFILTRSYAWPWKLGFLLVFLTYFLTPVMTFAYMQEIIHLLLALVIGHLLLVIVQRDEIDRPWRLIATCYALIAVAALLRPHWVFWAAGFLAIVRSRRDLALFGLLAVAYLGLGAAFLKLFYAPYPYYTPLAGTFAALAQFHIAEALRAYLGFLSENLSKLFRGDLYIFGLTHLPNAYTFLIGGFTVYLFYRYHRYSDRLALAVACVSAPYILTFVFIWDTLSLARHLGVIFVLQVMYLVMSGRTALVCALAAAQIALFPLVVGIMQRVVDLQASAGEYAVQHREQLRKVQDIGSAIRTGHRATIYLDDALTNIQYPLTIHLPLRSGDGYPLRYSQDISATRPMPERKFDPGFLDFVLSAEALSRPDLALAYQVDNLYLYKVADKP